MQIGGGLVAGGARVRAMHLAEILPRVMTRPFRRRPRTLSATRSCGANLCNATATIRDKRARVVAEVPDWEELREAGRAIKVGRHARLDEYLVQFEASVQAAGGHVHWARDAAEANRIVLDVARHTARRKS